MSTFEECFRISFPKELMPTIKVTQFDKYQKDTLLFGSETALKEPYISQDSIQSFKTHCPNDYVVLGFWGHGVNSYAFHYSIVDKWRKVLFRLPYGGVYSDNEKDAENIREFVSKYIEFEKVLKGKVKSWIAIDSMGEGYYKLVTKDGKVIETSESLLRKPDFNGEFGRRLK